MKRLLWVGDAGCDSGFARCTHRTLDTLKDYFDVTVLGINYRGDPHPWPYPMYPAINGGEFLGWKRLKEKWAREADVIVLQNDPWNIPYYHQALKGKGWDGVVIGALAIDSKNVRSTKYQLNEALDHAIIWTDFGVAEARTGGMRIPATVVPLGVDLDVFKPGDRQAARDILFEGNDPEVRAKLRDAFIVGNINRNQPRKRLDLTIRYFAAWVNNMQIPDAYLYLHVCPTGDRGIDCQQLANYYGVGERLILAEPEVWNGASVEHVVATYQAFDIQINTALGEGWGLTTMEGMACGIPQIVPDWAALGCWPGDAVVKVECEPVVFSSPTNQVGGVLDKTKAVMAMDDLYLDSGMRDHYRRAGLERVALPEYRWENIGRRFLDVINTTISEHEQRIQDRGVPANAEPTPSSGEEVSR